MTWTPFQKPVPDWTVNRLLDPASNGPDSVVTTPAFLMAVGGGAALKLFYDNPNLDIRFIFADEALDPAVLESTDVYKYDDLGRCVRMKL